MTYGPETWGPSFWKVIHIVAFYLDHLYMNKPAEALERWQTFLKGITMGIPCTDCESHFRTFQAKNPPPTSSNGPSEPSFLKWTSEAHNKVRERNGKFVPSVDDVVKAYQAGSPYELSSNVLLKTNMTFDVCGPFKSKLIGWQVGFGIACFVVLVLLIVSIRVIQKPKKR